MSDYLLSCESTVDLPFSYVDGRGISVLFYTYNGAFGKSPDWLNMTIFFLSAAIVFILETLLFKQDSLHCRFHWIPFAVIYFIGVLFILFTFITPKIPVFQNPLTGLYGLQKL